MKQFSIILVAAVITSVAACKKEPRPTAGKYDNAKLVVNEGPFMSGSGTLSAVWNDSTSNEVFQVENGFPAGNILQHAAIEDSLLFLSANGSNTVLAVNRATLRTRWTVNIVSPRFLLPTANGLFVTNWGSNFVYQLDLLTGAVLDSFNVHGPSESIAYHEGQVFVGRGGYSNTDTLAQIDPSLGLVRFTRLGDVPQSMVSYGTDLYLLCSGYTDWNTGSHTAGSLWRYQGTTDTWEMEAVVSDSTQHPQDLASDGEYLYFLNNTYGGAVLSYTPQSGIWPSTSGFGGFAYHWTLLNDTAYLFDARDYASNGAVHRYTKGGVAVDTVEVGIIPRQILQ